MIKNQKRQSKTWRKVKLGEVMSTAQIDFEKVKTSEYKTTGRFPIFDQGSDNIAGYTDNLRAEYKGKSPAILFGDHTLKLKIAKPPFAIGADGVQILEPNESLFDRKFFYYAIKGLKVRSYGYERHMKYLRELEITCPTIVDQKRISNILSAFDDKVELNNKINWTLEEMTQAIFKEWFVDFRFPGYEKVKMVDSELGKIPEGWEIKTLGEILTLEYGEGLTSINRKKGNIPVYGSSGLVGYHDKKLVNGPGIIVGRAGIPGSVYWSETDFYCVDSTFYVETKISKYFLFYLLKRQNLKSLISGSAVPGINRNIIYTNRIILPSPEIINDFEKVVSPIFSKIYQNKLENQKLAALRDLLLPKLMSGEIRV